MSSDETPPNEKAMAKQEAFLQKDYELKIGDHPDSCVMRGL
jgi:hypothetical protein